MVTASSKLPAISMTPTKGLKSMVKISPRNEMLITEEEPVRERDEFLTKSKTGKPDATYSDKAKEKSSSSTSSTSTAYGPVSSTVP